MSGAFFMTAEVEISARKTIQSDSRHQRADIGGPPGFEAAGRAGNEHR